MNQTNILLPKKKVTTRYQFKTWFFLPTETSTATSQGDPGNTCTTITTTTHYLPEN
jgi:hypothetical protein